MSGRHRAGGVSCWYYQCLHIARNDDGTIHRSNGLPMLVPDNHAECGMWTAATTAEYFQGNEKKAAS